MYKHSTFNLQRNPVRDFATILNYLDNVATWDSWSFHEVTTTQSDFAVDGNCMVITSVGALKHTVVIAPPSPRSFAVAIAVHARWTAAIHTVRHSYKALSVMLRAFTTTSSAMNIQLLSVHTPHLMGREIEDFERTLRERASLLRGVRRNRICVEIDANVELDASYHQTGCIETAIEGTGRRRQGAQAEATAMMAEELEGARLTTMNTFRRA